MREDVSGFRGVEEGLPVVTTEGDEVVVAEGLVSLEACGHGGNLVRGGSERKRCRVPHPRRVFCGRGGGGGLGMGGSGRASHGARPNDDEAVVRTEHPRFSQIYQIPRNVDLSEFQKGEAMKIDRYTQTMLTLIAACLVWLCFQRSIQPVQAAAPQEVVITGVKTNEVLPVGVVGTHYDQSGRPRWSFRAIPVTNR